MDFFSPNYLDCVMAWSEEKIYSLALKLPLNKEEFCLACKNRNAEKVNDILAENIMHLTGTRDTYSALDVFTWKFPELNLNLPSVPNIKKKILIIARCAHEMLKIARERVRH